MKVRWLTLLCWLLAGVLMWAGAVKALDPAALAESITGFNIVPWSVAVAGAFYLPWLELVVGVGLLVPRWRTGSAWVAALLFTGFTLLWVVTWARGINVACGCFGSGGETSVAWGLARTTGLAVVGWVCVKADFKRTDS